MLLISILLNALFFIPADINNWSFLAATVSLVIYVYSVSDNIFALLVVCLKDKFYTNQILNLVLSPIL
jgi:hypothetical protein